MDPSLVRRRSMFSRKPRITSVRVSTFGGQQAPYFEDTNFDGFMVYVEQVARLLSHSKNRLIGIAIEKSVQHLAVLRGIMNSGNAFISLPIDSEDYTWRLCERFRVNVVISRRRHENWDCEWRFSARLKLYFAWIHDEPLRFPEAPNERIAYAIQTSGTTGEPKVVHVPYSCIVPNIVDFIRRFGIHEESRILFLTALSFDPSIVEIFLHLYTNCDVVIVPDSMTPSLLRLLDYDFLHNYLLGPSSRISVLAIGGEAFPTNFIQSIRSPLCPTRVINLYGVTEVSCWASSNEVQPKDTQIHVGEPLLSTSIYVENGKIIISGRRCAIDYKFAEGQSYLTSDEASLIDMGDGRLGLGVIGRVKPSGVKPMTEVEAFVLSHFKNVVFAKLLFIGTSRVLLIQKLPGTHSPSLSRIKKEFPRIYCPTRIVDFNERVPVTSNGKVDEERLIELVKSQIQIQNSHFLFKTLAEDYHIFENHDSDMTLNSLGVDSLIVADMAHTFAKLLKHPYDEIAYFMQFLLNPKTTVADLYKILTKHENLVTFETGPKKKGDGIHSNEVINIPVETSKFMAIEKWCYNSKKCIDASPILYKNVVYVGSHSGHFVGVDFTSGDIVLDLPVKERIQGTCAIYKEFVAFGTFNNTVYVINREYKSVWRRFLLDGQVKMRPRFASTGYLYVGTYNGSMYKLDVQNKEQIWCQDLRGNVLSRPVLYDNLVVAATQSASIFGIDMAEGKIRWKFATKNPIFADLSVHENMILAVDVGGIAYKIDPKPGVLKNIYETNQVCFSPPLVLPSKGLLIATNRGFIHYLSKDLELMSIFHIEATVVQPPLVVENFLFLVDTTPKARLIRIRLEDLVKTTKHQVSSEVVLTLQSESFGLPIVRCSHEDGSSYEVIVGSRDDCLRRFDLVM